MRKVNKSICKERNEIINMIKYKGYKGSFSFDEIKSIFYGRVTNSPDVITFHGKSIMETRQAFRDAINEHLEWCAKYNKIPEKTASIEN